MRNALALLQAVTSAIPTRPNQHHALTLSPDDPAGLIIHVIRNDRFYTIRVDEEDLDRDIKDVVSDVLKLLKELPS